MISKKWQMSHVKRGEVENKEAANKLHCLIVSGEVANKSQGQGEEVANG